MTTDPLADLRREIALMTRSDRTAFATALSDSEHDLMHALGIGLLAYNDLHREDALAYEVDKLTAEQLEQLAPDLPPLPKATGGPVDFDPESRTFPHDQP
jgi:hypothetical protein